MEYCHATHVTFEKQDKIKFIDGTLDTPHFGSALDETWQICNIKVISWITRVVKDQIVQSTIYIENDTSLCEDMKERFSKVNNFIVLERSKELHSIRQGERNVNSFFTDLKIW